MKFKNALLGVLAVATLAFVPGNLVAQGPPPPGYRNGPGARQNWENAPSGYRDLQRQAFREGIDGARKDFGNHRRPDVNNRDEYRHPRVSGRDRRAYREAFRRGYQVEFKISTAGGAADRSRATKSPGQRPGLFVALTTVGRV